MFELQNLLDEAPNKISKMSYYHVSSLLELFNITPTLIKSDFDVLPYKNDKHN